MPVVGFICPIERTKVPFDHFDHCTANPGGRPAFPPWLANMIALKTQQDVRHASPELTATRTMGCPRKEFIHVLKDIYVDPSRRAHMDKGTAQHQVAAENLNPEVHAGEADDPTRMQVFGELFGVKLSGQIDAVRKDLTEIIDWKFPKDGGAYYRRKQMGKAKLEHRIQLNILRLLLDQQDWAQKLGYKVDDVLLTVWDHAVGKNEGPEMLDAKHMSEAEILMAKPWDGSMSVQQIVHVYTWALDGYRKLVRTKRMEDDKFLAYIPLVGESQATWMCDGCDVQDICTEYVRQYGKPVVEWTSAEPLPSMEGLLGE